MNKLKWASSLKKETLRSNLRNGVNNKILIYMSIKNTNKIDFNKNKFPWENIWNWEKLKVAQSRKKKKTFLNLKWCKCYNNGILVFFSCHCFFLCYMVSSQHIHSVIHGVMSSRSVIPVPRIVSFYVPSQVLDIVHSQCLW